MTGIGIGAAFIALFGEAQRELAKPRSCPPHDPWERYGFLYCRRCKKPLDGNYHAKGDVYVQR